MSGAIYNETKRNAVLATHERNYHMQYLIAFITLLLTTSLLQAQPPAGPPETREQYEKAYERRVRQEQLYGVYIPKDLADAFNELNKKIDADSELKFKNAPEEIVADRLFFSLGRWIIHNWGFYGGSRFSAYLKTLGLSHPDDMARFVILTYHRNLNRVPLEVKPLLESLIAARKQSVEERRRRGTVIYEETYKKEGQE